jgi:hypothetical protein
LFLNPKTQKVFEFGHVPPKPQQETEMSFQTRQFTAATTTGMSQIELEILYAKSQTYHAISSAFKASGAEAQLAQLGHNVSFAMDLMVQIVLHKRTSVSTMVGLLRKHFEAEEKPAQACADAIYKACQDDLIDYDPVSDKLVLRWGISPELQAQIDQYQYPLPMIEPPQVVSKNKQTGYRTIPGSMILKNNHHEGDLVLDHINRVNATPLALNNNVVAFVKNLWRNLDKQKLDETLEEFQLRKRAFEKYDRVSKDVIQGLLTMGSSFWLTHRYDKRGRSYCQGYHVNYQGNDWNKAVVEFAEPEVLA